VSKKGLFITFEGPEGCGKTTHIHHLAHYLQSRGETPLVTREPGGTVLGEQIRDILLDKSNRIDNMAEILLFAADRSQHLLEVIQPALQAGQTVLCDRYIDSTTAYQAGGKGLSREVVYSVNQFSGASFVPDLTILLDVDVQTGLQRATQMSADRFEQETLGFHERVRATYLDIAAQEPERVHLIDTADRGIDDIQAEIQEIVMNSFKL